MGRLFLYYLIIFNLIFFSAHDTVKAETLKTDIYNSESDYFIAGIEYQVGAEYSNLVISANDKLDFVEYTLEDPYRIVIDFIGVVFCELQDHIDMKEGPIKKVDLIAQADIDKKSTADKYFYPVDYIIVQLNEYRDVDILGSTDGKIIALKVYSATETDSTAPGAETEKPVSAKTGVNADTLAKKQEPLIIEAIEYETRPGSAMVSLVSNKDLKPLIKEQYNPYRMVIIPGAEAITELENEVEPADGLVRKILISKSDDIGKQTMPNEFFYTLNSIIIEPIIEMPFTVHAADGGTITVIRLESLAKQELKVAEDETQITPEEASENFLYKEEKPAAEQTSSGEEKQDLLSRVYEQKPLELSHEQQTYYQNEEEKTEHDMLIDSVAEKLYRKQKQEAEKKRSIREAQDKSKAVKAIEEIGIDEIEQVIAERQGVVNLNYCIDTALSYSEEAAIAEEEITLSEYKLKENFRALFPNAKLKGSKTTGDTVGADFVEQIYGVEAQYPIYQGGRLWNAYQQSKVNLNLSKARYNKTVHDLNYKVAEAYYNLLSAVMNLKLQRELLEKSENILKISEKRHDAGLSTDLEYLNVKSQYNQVGFQLASAQRDAALARFKLEQAIGLDMASEQVDIGEIVTDLKFQPIDIDLNKCLELAQEYHPDLIVNELLIESADYDEKIAKGKNKFNVELTGFYGASDSHYATEEEDFSADWNIGFKISKPFGASTASYSFTKEQTKRKVGLTDRQGTDTHSGEIAILDAMNIKSEVQEAEIKKHKARKDLLEVRRQISLETKEAYYNYQEALIQVKNSLEKVRFQQESVKTAKAQAELNEALQSQQLEAEIKLADERSVYVKALSDFNFSLIKLNKAIGIENYFYIE